MIIYDPAEGAADEAPRFFTRFAQRFVSALSSPTEEGSMYEADMQLRPSGKAGPVAVRLSSFGDYYRDSAWTWERMALTRARIVAGEGDLGEKINAHIATALAQPATAEQIVADVLDMRRRLERDRPAKGGWDLKRRPGGILDIEFIAQASQLLLAQTGRFTAQLNTADQLEAAQAAGLLSREETELLQAAAALWLGLSQIIRTAHGAGFDPGSASQGFATRLSQLAGQSSLSSLSRQIEDKAGRARRLFETCLGHLREETTELTPRFVEWGARPNSGD
jgi:glutamate-ammonia-ligase adenylyltransferase